MINDNLYSINNDKIIAIYNSEQLNNDEFNKHLETFKEDKEIIYFNEEIDAQKLKRKR